MGGLSCPYNTQINNNYEKVAIKKAKIVKLIQKKLLKSFALIYLLNYLFNFSSHKNELVYTTLNNVCYTLFEKMFSVKTFSCIFIVIFKCLDFLFFY